MSPEKISDWICMCAAGQSILGDSITEEMLLEVEKRYDPAFYTAMIWPHHPWEDAGGMLAREMYTYNLGRVAALKTERVDGVLKLFAQYIPNRFLIDLNEQGQKLFSSAEFWLDFQGQGYPYLVGVTATDIPASTHTEIMKFSAAGKNKDFQKSEFSQFSLGPLHDEKKETMSIFDRFFSKKKATQLSQTDNSTEEPENMDELKQLIEAMMAKIDAAIAAAKGDTADTEQEATEEVQVQAEEVVELAEEVAALAEEVVENPEDEVVAEQFSAAREDLSDALVALKAFTASGKGKSDPKRRARDRRRSRRESYSARRKGDGGDMKGLRDEVAAMAKQLSALTKQGTARKPGTGSGGEEKKMTLV